MTWRGCEGGWGEGLNGGGAGEDKGDGNRVGDSGGCREGGGKE